MTEAFRLFLREKGVSKKTALRYSKIIELVQSEHGSIALLSAKTAIVDQLERHSPASANKYVLAFKAWCKFVKQDWAQELHQKKEKPIPRRRPSVELARDIIFIKPQDTRDPLVHQKYSLLTELLFLTGMRQKEARKLKSKNVTDEEIIIEQSKTGPGRRVATPPFPDFLERLKNYQRKIKTTYLFSNEREDKPISDRAYRKEFKDRLSQLGAPLDITPHSFRGAFLTRNLRKGANLFDVQDIVGHTSADTTKLYYRGDLETQRDVMRQDPANIAQLEAEQKIAILTENIKKSGLLDDPNMDFTFSKHSIHIEMSPKKCHSEGSESSISKANPSFC